MPRNWKEVREKRRIKRQQVEQSYKEYVPPQVRQHRQGRWFARVNEAPQFVAYEGAIFDCPDCDKRFVNMAYLKTHVKKKHYPHAISNGRTN